MENEKPPGLEHFKTGSAAQYFTGKGFDIRD
jgi:hypothetical protein